jgi:hypothetical protein
MTSGGAKALLIVFAFGLMAGIGSLIFGIQNYSLAGQTQTDPQVISAANLIKNGPGDNHYVHITNVDARLDAVIVQGGDRETHWDKAYIPMSPADDGGDNPNADDSPRIILVSDDVKDRDTLHALAKTHDVTGVIGAWDTTLDDKARDLLKEKYPKLDVARCQIVGHNQTPPTRGGSFACMGIGIALIIGVLGLGILTRIKGWGKALVEKRPVRFAPTGMFPPPVPMPPVTPVRPRPLPGGGPPPPPVPPLRPTQ